MAEPPRQKKSKRSLRETLMVGNESRTVSFLALLALTLISWGQSGVSIEDAEPTQSFGKSRNGFRCGLGERGSLVLACTGFSPE
jgi:hypothetical protein